MALGQTSDISCCATDFRRNDVQPATCEKSGLGFGTVITSLLFLISIAAVITYMSLSHDGEEVIVKTSPIK